MKPHCSYFPSRFLVKIGSVSGEEPAITINRSLSVIFCLGLLMVLLLVGSGKDSASESPAPALEILQKGEAVALIRHAIAPGTGDPPGFILRDCSTQRNLSEAGRIQARRIGDFFRSQGITTASVYSSQWCRCLETARLLGLGPVKELPALNSFFEESEKEQERTQSMWAFLLSRRGQGPAILVTHQVNITALTGVFPASGEIIIFQAGKKGRGKILRRFVP